MSNWIPKEKLTAYQRWEVAAFDEEQRGMAAASAPPDPLPENAPPALATEPASAPPETPVLLPTADDIERMYGDAHDTGYAAGYTEGIAAAKAVAATIAALMDSLTHALAGIEQGVADQLLALAIEIANQVLRQSLRLQPELLLPVVREAVATLQPHQGQPLLFIHPDDAALVRRHLGEQLSHSNWRIIEDSRLTAGGCRVELGASEVDATLETRWRRVVEAIGVGQEWLKPGQEANPR